MITMLPTLGSGLFIRAYGRHGKILQIDHSLFLNSPYQIELIDGTKTFPKGYIGRWSREGFDLDQEDDELRTRELEWRKYFG